jgi:hypothetical protein
MTARRYRIRPSSMLNIADPIEALDFDCALALRTRNEEDQALNDLVEGDHWLALLLSLLRIRL